jgi:hypothetical protein
MKVWRHFTDVRALSLVQTIKESTITTVVFVKRPCFHFNSTGGRLVDQLQRDLLLGQEADVIWNVVFLRRTGSSAQSLGKYIRAAIKQLNVSVAYEAATVTTASGHWTLKSSIKTRTVLSHCEN